LGLDSWDLRTLSLDVFWLYLKYETWQQKYGNLFRKSAQFPMALASGGGIGKKALSELMSSYVNMVLN
jgi:hypothetical protein